MATEYTDVDRLILDRWQDVVALIDAHEDLEDRIEEVIGEVGEGLGRWLEGMGYSVETNAKEPSFYVGHDDWYHKRKDDWTLYFEIGGFAPRGFGKAKETHPYAWLHTANLEFLKMKDAERVEFARALRIELGDSARNWADAQVDDADSPLGRYYKDVSEADRVGLIADPDKLYEFVKRVCEDLSRLTDPIDRVLERFRSRE